MKTMGHKAAETPLLYSPTFRSYSNTSSVNYDIVKSSDFVLVR